MSDAGDRPDPLTPPDCDLRGMPYMPLDLVRLFDSDFYAISTGDEFKVGLTLWCRSFLQVPAGSLPADDRILAHLSGAGRAWQRVRDVAMRGWVKCSDGRLYHPVVAAKARDAWEKRIAFRERTRNATEARRLRREQRYVGNKSGGTSDATDNVTSTKGEGEGTRKKERTPQPPKGGGVDLPEWIPRAAWDAYVASRAKLRKPLTDQARRLTIEKLDGFRRNGFSVEEALNNSTEHGWTGVFEPKPSAPMLPLNGTAAQYADPRYFKPNEPADILKLPEPQPGTQEYRGYMEAEMGRWADFPDDHVPRVPQ